MSSIDLKGLTLLRAAAALRQGQFTSVALVTALLEAIAAQNSRLNAYIWCDAEDALAQAAAADKALAAAAPGRLLGVPLAIKDNISVAGQPCSAGSTLLQGYHPPFDAALIERLRRDGALFVGRTNMDEFGYGAVTHYSHYGRTGHPLNPELTPGGSSGGSAAAVADGMALAALGSDTGGSVRQPAALCGCVGFKPSYGVVPRHGVAAFASSLDQVGPLTQNVADAALLLATMAGAEPRDAMTLPFESRGLLPLEAATLKGVRIGLPREYLGDNTAGEVVERVQAVAELCRRQGATIVDLSLPHTKYVTAVYYAVIGGEGSANLARYDGIRYGRRSRHDTTLDELYSKSRGEGFSSEVKRRVLLGTYLLLTGAYERYYERALKVRTLIKADFQAAFAGCDLLLTPTTASTAFKVPHPDTPSVPPGNGSHTSAANLAGLPAISLPCGSASDGLPLAVQLLGPPLADVRLLQLAATCEAMLAEEYSR